ncbi:MAG: type III-B CRISPR module RAMP protein Cmr4 [bacterium]
MMHTHDLLLYQTITPLHVGCGQDVGVVDLPVIRERTTGYPYIPGSGARGALRAAFASPPGDESRRDELFGPEAGGDLDDRDVRYAGSVSIHDAKLLLFPVRSSPGVYVWLTAPTPLRRLVRDLDAFGIGLPDLRPDLDPLLAPDVGGERLLTSWEPEAETLCLEEYAYEALGESEDVEAARAELHRWSGAVANRLNNPYLEGRVVAVSDEAFRHFSQVATVVQQHNKLTSAKTVAGTALFSLEAVPPEAVFYGLVGATESRWIEQAEERLAPRAVLDRLREGFLPRDGGDPPKEVPNPAHSAERGTFQIHLGGGEATGLGVTALVWPRFSQQTGAAEKKPRQEAGHAG